MDQLGMIAMDENRDFGGQHGQGHQTHRQCNTIPLQRLVSHAVINLMHVTPDTIHMSTSTPVLRNALFHTAKCRVLSACGVCMSLHANDVCILVRVAQEVVSSMEWVRAHVVVGISSFPVFNMSEFRHHV